MFVELQVFLLVHSDRSGEPSASHFPETRPRHRAFSCSRRLAQDVADQDDQTDPELIFAPNGAAEALIEAKHGKYGHMRTNIRPQRASFT